MSGMRNKSKQAFADFVYFFFKVTSNSYRKNQNKKMADEIVNETG